MLGHLGHASSATSMKICSHSVFRGIGKINNTVLPIKFSIEIHNLSRMSGHHLWPNQRYNPRFWWRQIAVEIYLQNCLHIGGLGHCISCQLCQIRFWEPAQCDQNLGIGFAQNRCNLVWFQQWINRICDTRDAATDQGKRCLITNW